MMAASSRPVMGLIRHDLEGAVQWVGHAQVSVSVSLNVQRLHAPSALLSVEVDM